jgi:hypothetical protein
MADNSDLRSIAPRSTRSGATQFILASNSGNYFAIERSRKNALSFARENRFGATLPVAGL